MECDLACFGGADAGLDKIQARRQVHKDPAAFLRFGKGGRVLEAQRHGCRTASLKRLARMGPNVDGIFGTERGLQEGGGILARPRRRN